MNERLLIPALRFPVDDLDPHLRLAERGVGGFCVFSADATLSDILARLQDAAPHPLLIASDLEQGAGQHIPGCSLHPPAAALDPDAAEAAGARTALEARPFGITMTFAPVCDVASHPRNPIIQARAFADPVACAPRFVAGARRFGLRTCAKHFPGHGATEADSHDALPVVEAASDVWRSRDLPPFAAVISAGVDAIMTAHVACPALTGSDTLPATLSEAVMTGLLRRELGFFGLVITDALIMEGVRGAGLGEAEAARMSIQAGCDAVLCPEDVDGVLVALGSVEAGAARQRLAAAAEPLPEPLQAASAASIVCEGPLPAGPGPHPLRICDLHGAGEALAAAAGVAFERYAPDGTQLETGGDTGLDRRCVAVSRHDKAWGGPLALPPAVRSLADKADLLILLGPRVLGEGLTPRARIWAPGEDPTTLKEVFRRAFALNYRGSSS